MRRGPKVPPIFICENNRKSNKIMHCIKEKKLSGSFEDRAIFHVMQLSYDRVGWGGLCAHYRSIDKYVKNAHNMALSSQPPLKKNQHSA